MKDVKKQFCKLISHKNHIKKSNNKCDIMPKVFLIVGLVAGIVTTALCIYSYIDNLAYRRKWKEYDDCGI